MKMKKRSRYITLATIAFWTVVLIGWHLYDPSSRFVKFEPGADKRPVGSARKADDVVIGEFFMKYNATFTEGMKDQWSGFRGKDRTNIVSHAVPIKLAEGNFKELWTVETGEGHAAPAVWKGRVYMLDYNEQLSSDALRCFDLKTGAELWRRWYRVPMKRNHGFSRTIPAVTEDGKVMTIGPEGHVMCCNGETGDLLWTLDLKKRHADGRSRCGNRICTLGNFQ